MSDDAKNKSCFELEKRSIPELEALLQQDFTASKEDQLDVDYTVKIMEVIRRKEQEMPDYTPVDVDQAWNEFSTQYNTPEGKATFLYGDNQFKDNRSPAHPATPIFRLPRRRLIRRVVFAAILVLLIAMSTIPVFGYASVFQMIGHWTAEQFSFNESTKSSSDNIQTNNSQTQGEYTSLQDALTQYGIGVAVAPQYIPDGFQLQEIWAQEFPETGNIELDAPYAKGDESIMITIIKHADSFSRKYEKDGQTVETYTAGNVAHYIFHNIDEVTAAWYVGSLECSISTTLSVDDLKKMIDSIY